MCFLPGDWIDGIGILMGSPPQFRGEHASRGDHRDWERIQSGLAVGWIAGQRVLVQGTVRSGVLRAGVIVAVVRPGAGGAGAPR